MDFEIKDLAGVSEPLKKFIEVVSAGIGACYRPRGMRNEADSHAYAIKAIAAAEAEAEEIKRIAQANGQIASITALAGENPGLIERARVRLVMREIEGQRNIEAIAENALPLLPETVSDKPVSDDWRRKFFLEAENICDKDLQLLWGKVLAGEVASPGSYGLRTLEVLKHLSKEEAEFFRQACAIAFEDGWIMKPAVDPSRGLQPYGLDYDALLVLRDAGLLFDGDTLIKDGTNWANVPSVILANNGIYMQISGPHLQGQQIPSLPFTRAGRELQNLLPPNPCMPFLQAVAGYFRARGLTVKKGKFGSSGGVTGMSFEEDF